jgi:hypothetical protein
MGFKTKMKSEWVVIVSSCTVRRSYQATISVNLVPVAVIQQSAD